MSETAAVILAGGKSSRLFPFNKVLSDLTGSGRTLLQQAYDRVKSSAKGQVFVLTTQEMVAPVQRQLKLNAEHVLVDPVRRGTWPAILWAMAHWRETNPETVMAVITADHVIQDKKAFQSALEEAIKLARTRSAVVMMGIPPSEEAAEWRGFGCFRIGKASRIAAFEEKPTLEAARLKISEGGWQWNSGMFFFRIATAEKALEKLQPQMYKTYCAMRHALAAHKPKQAETIFKDFQEKIPHPLDPSRLVDNSIDYAIMTPLIARAVSGLEACAVGSVEFQWTDLGQWDALRKVVTPGPRGNICVGDVRVDESVHDSILVAEEGHRIEVSGLQGMIVAVADKRALVLPVSEASRVKEIVTASGVQEKIVGDSSHRAAFTLGKSGRLSILSNRPKEAL